MVTPKVRAGFAVVHHSVSSAAMPVLDAGGASAVGGDVRFLEPRRFNSEHLNRTVMAHGAEKKKIKKKNKEKKKGRSPRWCLIGIVIFVPD
jgi:hypothetical protein